MMSKGFCLLAALAISSAAQARGGGDGPCPVPNYQPEYVVAKRCIPIANPVGQLKVSAHNPNVLAFEDNHRRLKWSAIEGGICESDRGPVLFNHPLSLWLNQTKWPIPKAHENATIVAEHGLQALAISGRQLLKIDAKTAIFSPVCEIPPAYGSLQTVQHSPDSNSAWLYKISHSQTGSVIHFYQFFEKNCYWQSPYSLKIPKALSNNITVLTVSAAESENRGAAIFKGGNLYWVSARGSEQLDSYVQQVDAVSYSTPTILAQNLEGKLQIFFPERGLKSTLFEDVFGFTPGKAVFDNDHQRLFVASSIGGEEREGVFEFELRLPH